MTIPVGFLCGGDTNFICKNIIFMVVITPSPGMVVTNRTDLARQSYLVAPIAHKSTVHSAKGIRRIIIEGSSSKDHHRIASY